MSKGPIRTAGTGKTGKYPFSQGIAATSGE
jgi:hypothetical protein